MPGFLWLVQVQGESPRIGWALLFGVVLGLLIGFMLGLIVGRRG